MHTPISPVNREAMVALQGYWEFTDSDGARFDVDWATTEKFENYIRNFKANAIGQRVPIFDIHKKEEAYGWITDFYIKPATKDDINIVIPGILDGVGREGQAFAFPPPSVGVPPVGLKSLHIHALPSPFPLPSYCTRSLTPLPSRLFIPFRSHLLRQP